ncbi:MAG: TetR/AcrR family transcriptional regulator, partial [Treponema sp.]|nr:TetR/AcrR family transcriptional regulator [Treponema sp.]
MDKKPTKRQLQAQETKKKIRDSAIMLWHENDYEQTTIEQICGAAGVSTGLFYNYYGSKEELLGSEYALFEELIDKVIQNNAFVCHLDALRTVVYLYVLNAVDLGYKIVTQWFRIQLSVSNKFISNKSSLVNMYIKDLTRKALKAGELHKYWDAESASHLILCQMRGTVFDWAIHGGSYDVVTRIVRDLETTLRILQENADTRADKKILA